jgi:hypothetical protein
MIWVYAGRVIAGVPNDLSLWDFAVVGFVGHLMRPTLAAQLCLYLAVARITATNPLPTTIFRKAATVHQGELEKL